MKRRTNSFLFGNIWIKNTLLHLSNNHIITASDKIANLEFADWYLADTAGLDENYGLQEELKALKEEIINKDVKHPDTLAYKKNILNQIGLLEECLGTLNTNAVTYGVNEHQMLDYLLNEDIKKLRKNIKEMSKLLDKYYD